MSERKVTRDQRATENTLSNNRQSQLESEYTADFRDGKRVDAIEIIKNKLGRFSKSGSQPKVDHLKASRLACLVFEVSSYCINKFYVATYEGLPGVLGNKGTLAKY